MRKGANCTPPGARFDGVKAEACGRVGCRFCFGRAVTGALGKAGAVLGPDERLVIDRADVVDPFPESPDGFSNFLALHAHFRDRDFGAAPRSGPPVPKGCSGDPPTGGWTGLFPWADPAGGFGVRAVRAFLVGPATSYSPPDGRPLASGRPGAAFYADVAALPAPGTIRRSTPPTPRRGSGRGSRRT